jgi:hypothetical protein
MMLDVFHLISHVRAVDVEVSVHCPIDVSVVDFQHFSREPAVDLVAGLVIVVAELVFQCL